MVTGSMPFVSERPLEVVTMRLTHDPPPPRKHVPSLDARWNDAILRCLARDPAARFASAREAVDALVAPGRFAGRGRVAAGAAIAVGALAVAGAVRWERTRDPARASLEQAVQTVSPAPADEPKRRPVLAVLAPKSTSGGADAVWISVAIADVLRSDLQADEALRIVPGDRTERAVRELGIAGAPGVTPPLLVQIRANLGADYVVAGTYAVAGADAVHVEATLEDARSGALLAKLASDGSRANLPDLVRAIGASIRKTLGMREPSDVELTAARAAAPATPDASRAYAEGEAELAASDLRGARASFERAVEADPSSPLAHAGLAMAASALGDDATAVEHAKRAFETSHGLSREDQLAVEARYRGIAKQWDRAVEIWRTLFGFAPDNLEYGLRYAQSLWAAGRPKDAFPVILALRALPAPDRDDPRIDYYESVAASKVSDFHRMAAAGRVAAEKAERVGAWSVAAHGHHQVAEAHMFLHEDDAAIPEWTKAREEYAKVADRQGEADSIKGLADVYSDTGDPGRALPMLESALAMTREVGSRYKIANGVQDVGTVLYASGDTAGARTRFDEARGLYEAIHDREGIGNALGNKARTLWDDGDLAAARSMATDARARLGEVDERDGVTAVTLDLAEMALVAGDLALAASEAAKAETLAKDLGIAFYSTRSKTVRAGIAREAGDGALATRLANEARAEYGDERAGSEVLEGEALLARLALDEGRAADAAALASEVATGAHASSVRSLEASALAILATALAAEKKSEDAASAAERASTVEATQAQVRIEVALARAAVLAATPDGLASAQKILADARGLAERSGFVASALEVRLASGAIARGLGSRSRLEAVAKDAGARGLVRIARAAQAGAALVVTGEQAPSSMPAAK
jgi:hypothetical protein